MGKEDNTGIKIIYINLLKKIIKNTIFLFYLYKKKLKNMQIFSYLKNTFRHT